MLKFILAGTAKFFLGALLLTMLETTVLIFGFGIVPVNWYLAIGIGVAKYFISTAFFSLAFGEGDEEEDE